MPSKDIAHVYIAIDIMQLLLLIHRRRSIRAVTSIHVPLPATGNELAFSIGLGERGREVRPGTTVATLM